MKIPFTKSALEKFREREREIDAMGDVLVGLQKLAEGVITQIESARAVYYGSPTLENALKWENAKRRLSPNIALGMLEGERSTVQAAQNAERSKPEYVALLARALGEHNEGIQAVYQTKRSALLESLKTSGETGVSVDGMPTLRGLVERIDRNKNTITFMEHHPDNAARNMHVANALAFLNEPVDLVAPAPPAARAQQGHVPGGNLPLGHAILHPTNPVADTRIQAVPAEVDQAIKAKLIREQNEHFERQQAQMAEQLEAQRLASLAKLQPVEA